MKELLRRSFLVLVCLFCAQSCLMINVGNPSASKLEEVVVQKGKSLDKILLIDLIGEISLESERSFFYQKVNAVQRVVSRLERAKKDPQIKAVILRVNSPGGGVTASEMLYYEIKKFRRLTKKPVYAYIVNMAASGGYYAAMACEKIYAPSSALVGSIGVVNFQPEVSELSKKVGVYVDVTKSGRNKDMGSPFRKLTEEEKRIKQEMVDQLAKTFVSRVVQERKIKAEKKKQLIATARIFLAEKAFSLGLIDKIANFDEMIKIIREKDSSVGEASPQLVSFKGNGDTKRGIYNFSSHSDQPQKMQSDFSGLTKIFFRKGFYYLAE